jgi:Spondin_N
MRALPLRLLVIALALTTACGKKGSPKKAAATNPPPPPRSAGPAEYTVIVKSLWTKRNFPLEYPNGAKFSGLIGASHNPRYALFAVGRRPSPGLIRLSEEGKHSPLSDEIQSAVDRGTALEKFESGSLKNFSDSIVTSVRVDPAHPLISFVAMLQPSPDWFTGAADVALSENGGWVRRKTLTLMAYDAGADAGTTYESPDRPRNPTKPTSRSTNRHFLSHGKPRPVATVTLIRSTP